MAVPRTFLLLVSCLISRLPCQSFVYQDFSLPYFSIHISLNRPMLRLPVGFRLRDVRAKYTPVTRFHDVANQSPLTPFSYYRPPCHIFTIFNLLRYLAAPRLSSNIDIRFYKAVSVSVCSIFQL